MTKIVVTSKKPVLTAERGRLPMNLPVEVSPLLAKQLLESGVAVLFETKEKMDRPMQADGATAPSSALQAGRVSQPPMLSESESGAKRRGRPRKEASLSQTPATA